MGAVLFDVAPDAARSIGVMATMFLLAVGIVTWAALRLIAKRFSHHDFAGITSLAIWAHSFIEGALAALSFKVNPELGVIVSIGLLLHLLPEFFAVVAILKQHGLTTKQAVWVDVVTVGILATSLAIFRFAFPAASSAGLSISATVIGGAFLYIGSVVAYRFARNLQTATGLASGLALTFAWSIVMLRVFHL